MNTFFENIQTVGVNENKTIEVLQIIQSTLDAFKELSIESNKMRVNFNETSFNKLLTQFTHEQEPTNTLETEIIEPTNTLEPEITEPTNTLEPEITEPTDTLEPEITEPTNILEPEITEPTNILEPEIPEPASTLETEITEPPSILETEITEKETSLFSDLLEEDKNLEFENNLKTLIEHFEPASIDSSKHDLIMSLLNEETPRILNVETMKSQEAKDLLKEIYERNKKNMQEYEILFSKAKLKDLRPALKKELSKEIFSVLNKLSIEEWYSIIKLSQHESFSRVLVLLPLEEQKFLKNFFAASIIYMYREENLPYFMANNHDLLQKIPDCFFDIDNDIHINFWYIIKNKALSKYLDTLTSF